MRHSLDCGFPEENIDQWPEQSKVYGIKKDAEHREDEKLHQPGIATGSISKYPKKNFHELEFVKTLRDIPAQS